MLASDFMAGLFAVRAGRVFVTFVLGCVYTMPLAVVQEGLKSKQSGISHYISSPVSHNMIHVCNVFTAHC